MKKNLMKTFQRILSCITVITLIVGIMAGGAFAKYEDYTLEELIKKAISLSESERLDLLNELTQQDLDRFRNEVKNLSLREKGELVLKLTDNDDLFKFLREVLLTDPSFDLTIEDLKQFIRNRIVDPIEKLMKESIFLSLEERKELFAEYLAELDTYLKELTKDNYMTFAVLLSEKLSTLSKEEIGEALNKLANYSVERREEIIYFLRYFQAIDFDLDVSGFRRIAADFNSEITGDSENDFGINFIFCMIDIMSSISLTPSVRDDAVDPYKIEIKTNLLPQIKNSFDRVVGFFDIFKRRGIKDIDGLFGYLSATINRHDDMEIYYFKKEVLDQLGKRRYSGELLKPEETPTPTPEDPEETPTPDPEETPTPTPEDPEETPTPDPEETPTPTPTTKPTSRPPSGGGKVITTPTPTPTPTPDVEEPEETEVPGLPEDEIKFTDIDGHWAKEIILKLAKMDIVSGYPDGTIRPDASITRAEMAVIVVHAAGLEPAEKIDLKFEDSALIPEWAAGFIQTAVENDIIVGYEDNTFRASRELSREEMVVLILKAFDIAIEKGLERPAFLDGANIGTWSLDYIATSVKLAIVKGYPDNTFQPKKSVTRAEAFVVLYNTMLDRGLIPLDDEDKEEAKEDDDINVDDSKENDIKESETEDSKE